MRVGLAVTARFLHLGLSGASAAFQFGRVSEQQSGMEPQHRFSTDASVYLFSGFSFSGPED